MTMNYARYNYNHAQTTRYESPNPQKADNEKKTENKKKDVTQDNDTASMEKPKDVTKKPPL